MPVKEQWMYRANDSSLHESKDLAEHQNGLLALRAKLESETYTREDVVKLFQDWYLSYLEGRAK